MANAFFLFFTNKIFLSVMISFAIGGFIKIIIHYVMEKKLDLLVSIRSGGMPSTHTSTVAALTTSVFFAEGISNLFITCFVVSCVILTDAVGIRRAAGKQAEVLNQIVEDMRLGKEFQTTRLYELLGHTPKQALVGILIGIATSYCIFRLHF